MYACDSLQRTGSQESFVIWITLLMLHGFDSLQRTGSWESFVCDLNYTDCAVLTACGIINTERTNSAC